MLTEHSQEFQDNALSELSELLNFNKQFTFCHNCVHLTLDNIKHSNIMSSLHKIYSHVRSHVTQSDKSNILTVCNCWRCDRKQNQVKITLCIPSFVQSNEQGLTYWIIVQTVEVSRLKHWNEQQDGIFKHLSYAHNVQYTISSLKSAENNMKLHVHSKARYKPTWEVSW